MLSPALFFLAISRGSATGLSFYSIIPAYQSLERCGFYMFLIVFMVFLLLGKSSLNGSLSKSRWFLVDFRVVLAY